MIENNKPLKEGKEKIFNDLNTALNTNVTTYSWELELKKFPGFNSEEDVAPMEEIAQHPYFKPMFDVISSITENPCLYQFDIVSLNNRDSLIPKLIEIRDELTLNNLKMAPINQTSKSNVLYIGIRQPGKIVKKKLSKISSRLLAHFGYYQKGAGLQLKYWKMGDLKFKLTVYKLDKNTTHFLELIEKVYAMHENPVIGRH